MIREVGEVNKDHRLERSVSLLVDLLEAEFPDPVDVFEDAAAKSLGLQRHPLLPQSDWRRLRVAFLDARSR